MDKLAKKIRKALPKNGNLLVIGRGMGVLKNLLTFYDSVFVIDSEHPNVYSKNLIYKNFNCEISYLYAVNCIVIDRNKVEYLDKILPIIVKSRPPVIIEGEDPIPRTQSKIFFKNHYNHVSQHEKFHIWRKQ